MLSIAVLAACESDPSTPNDPQASALGAVLGSVDLTLTVFSPDSLDAPRTIGLGAAGSPVGFAVRDGIAAVPMGVVSAVAIVDLASASVLRTVALPAGSGATGIDFVNDSIALVANPNLNSVSPVNVRTGTAGEPIPVGVFPQSVRTVGDRVLVANANLVDFAPDGPGSVTVFDAERLTVSGTIPLSGLNPGAMEVGPGGRVFVLHSGRFGSADGSLSVVDPSGLREDAHHMGFGEFPGAIAVGDDGDVYVSSFMYGIAIFDPAVGAFVRPPDDALVVNGTPSTSGLGFDDQGRLYALEPQCQGPASSYRLTPTFEIEASVAVGICPIAIAFTRIGNGGS
jgi:hypothetical protein